MIVPQKKRFNKTQKQINLNLEKVKKDDTFLFDNMSAPSDPVSLGPGSDADGNHEHMVCLTLCPVWPPKFERVTSTVQLGWNHTSVC